MSEVFKPRDTPCYNLRHTWQSADPLHGVYNGPESVLYLGSKTGSKYLQKLKIRNLLMGLKEKSKD